MRSVHVVQHERPVGDDGTEVKIIGVYATRGGAEAAVERLRRQPGFASHPEGFTIDEYEVDRDHWTEGFLTLD
jgi:hypothetical protein